MRKKLDTRFPAARIKKIMQADEDVGKIAMAVPVLVSKALELFLQDLCDRTYDITLRRGAKTVNSLHFPTQNLKPVSGNPYATYERKHCVQSYNVFDFLREVVSKVPDYGHSDAAGEMPKRRKVAIEEHHDSEDEYKKSRTELSRPDMQLESCTSAQQSVQQNPNPGTQTENCSEPKESPTQDSTVCDKENSVVTTPNLKVNVDDNTDKPAAPEIAPCNPSPRPVNEKAEEGPQWSLEMDRMVIDPAHMLGECRRLLLLALAPSVAVGGCVLIHLL
uniref:Transcription factor CBF/NF-Y/archaeal histone domain-containing protein n=1 Tax=Solanum lycopersicum TaxID=4081 RepID=A0A3Q7F6H9_SOLLC